MTKSREGVIKYDPVFVERELSAEEQATARRLQPFRQRFFRLGLIGQDDSEAYGNLSARLSSALSSFVITGTQTSGLSVLDVARHYAVVEQYDRVRNTAVVSGPLLASSEVPSHAAIYDALPAVNAVFHAHQAQIWAQARELGIPITSADAEYGTPEMAAEIQRLVGRPAVQELGIIAMGGHPDGVISFDAWGWRAASTMIMYLHRAQAA